MVQGGQWLGGADNRQWHCLLGAVLAACCQLAEARNGLEPRRGTPLLTPAALLEQADGLADPPAAMPWYGGTPLSRPAATIVRDERNHRGPSVRGGVGLDLALPDTGKLHLDLLPARDVTRQGMRWQLGGEEPVALGKLWSLGGCLDLIRSRRSNPALYNGYGSYGGERHLQLAPQLIIDMDAFIGSDSAGRLVLQRGHWNDLDARDAGLGAVWQARLVWRF